MLKMKNIDIIHKEKTENNTNDLMGLISKKCIFFRDVINKTIVHLQKIKQLDIITHNETYICIDKLDKINKIVQKIYTSHVNDLIIQSLQTINNDLSSVIKKHGTNCLEDLLLICFGNNTYFSQQEQYKIELLNKYFHPISYIVINKEDKTKLKNLLHNNEPNNLSCYDISNEYKQFYVKIFGLKLYIYNSFLKKGMIVYGIIDNIDTDFLSEKYILDIKKTIRENLPKEEIFQNKENFEAFFSSLNLINYLNYDNKEYVYSKYEAYLNYIKHIRKNSIHQIVNEFISDNIYRKRNTLLSLLVDATNFEHLYLAYLLYDLLYNEVNENACVQEQVFDSLPFSVKKHLKQSITKTISYTNELCNVSTPKIPYEQQICLLKTNDTVKEKAIAKLKEIKTKSDETSSKARQYLDSLLKIPFEIYKKEPIFYVMNYIKDIFKKLYISNNVCQLYPFIPLKENYTNVEVMTFVKQIELMELNKSIDDKLLEFKKFLKNGKKKQLISNIIKVNECIKSLNLMNQINYASENISFLHEQFDFFIEKIKILDNGSLTNIINSFVKNDINNTLLNNSYSIKKVVMDINNNVNKITDYMTNTKNILNSCIYGHNNAKNEIEKIIAQWINGKDTTHILGLEGPPGVGKTTLARGLSKCLCDENGVTRPFSLIALGGDSNASTLIGHNYTYVGSSYGKIVQILIDSKCMNPIILFDEIDKISRTENGKELIGVLTHLLDATQNNVFEDKYFSGVSLDLSKVLFILSYNDVTSIDKVLLDRIHRIKFNNLTLEDKLVICNDHILPDLCKNTGLENMINISNDVLSFIIEEYTLESGVRKLKEKLFELIGEINLHIIKNPHKIVDIPITITIEDIKTKYFKDCKEIKLQQIHKEPQIGVINCLWANSYGLGGILSATAKFIHSDVFLSLTLTGLLDKMMEESFKISLTNAYNLITEETSQFVYEKYNGKNKFGIHLHMGDGSIEKSGTSAGIAITILMYSLLTNKKIKNDFAVTGEASDLNGKVGEIGGLKTKFLYGIKSGVKNFIYPKENKKDFEEFMNLYKDNKIIDNINFFAVDYVTEAINLIIEK